MRLPFLVAVLAVGAAASVAQPTTDPTLNAALARLFPSATSFSPKEGDPPHFKAYADDKGSLAGFAFWTTEVEPLERAWAGPVKMLVGMDTQGILTGIILVEHHEPYGDFSIDLPEFAAQFTGKSIRDPFRIGGDIDAVSRATITVTGTTRAVRNSARRIARQLLAPPEPRQ